MLNIMENKNITCTLNYFESFHSVTIKRESRLQYLDLTDTNERKMLTSQSRIERLQEWTSTNKNALPGYWRLSHIWHTSGHLEFETLHGAAIWLFILSVRWCVGARRTWAWSVYFCRTVTWENVDFNMNNNYCNKQLKKLKIPDRIK